MEGNKKKFCCDICDKICIKAWDMKKHIHNEHFSENGIPCPLCEVKFRKKLHKSKHLNKIHGMTEINVHGCAVIQESKRRVCKGCKNEFKTLYELKNHKRLHKCPAVQKCKIKILSVRSNTPDSVCPQCFKRFPTRIMPRHLEEEHELKLPTCGICGYTNRLNNMVIRHQRKVHYKERNVACAQCELKFFDNSQLKKHMVRHNPVKKFECKFCKKTFPRIGTLRMHEKIHTGDKQVVCYVCGERFVQKASLNYHMSKYHPDKVTQQSCLVISPAGT